MPASDAHAGDRAMSKRDELADLIQSRTGYIAGVTSNGLADIILAWLAEPAQVEAMAKASFERDGYNWASWCANEPDLAAECRADIRAALAALVPPAKET